MQNLAARLRQKNSIYLALSLFARVLNALGMFLALRRFAPSTFGEMSYLLATAVSVVAFCSLGLELSVNARLSRNLKEKVNVGPTIVAGGILALTGIVLATMVIVGGFASQLHVLQSYGLAVTGVCIYSSCMIITSLLTAMSFALGESINVGVNYLITTLVFIGFAVFANARASGVDLLYFFIAGQILGISYMSAGLLRGRTVAVRRDVSLAAASRTEVSTLFAYGAKQILVVSAVTFSQWLIQKKIVFGAGGASENAIYSIGNQIFNMMTFIPLIITPIIITRLAAAGDDARLRRSLCLKSLRMFALLALLACCGAFVGLRLGIPFLPPRYGAAFQTGMIASAAAAFQILKSPFSLYFLSELKASREIASAATGALLMIAATLAVNDLTPNEGTAIRLLGCMAQAVLLCVAVSGRHAPGAHPARSRRHGAQNLKFALTPARGSLYKNSRRFDWRRS